MKTLETLNEQELLLVAEYTELFGMTEQEALTALITEGVITESNHSSFKYAPDDFLELKYYEGNNKSAFFKLNKALKKAKREEMFELDSFFLGTKFAKDDKGEFILDDCSTINVGATPKIIINNISYKASRSAFDGQGKPEPTNFETTLQPSVFPSDQEKMICYGGVKDTNAKAVIDALKKEYHDGLQGKTQEKVPDKFKVKFKVVLFGLIETEDGWKKFYFDITNKYKEEDSLTMLWEKQCSDFAKAGQMMRTRVPATLEVTGTDSFNNSIIQAIPTGEYLDTASFKEIAKDVQEATKGIAEFIKAQQDAVGTPKTKTSNPSTPKVEDEKDPFEEE